MFCYHLAMNWIGLRGQRWKGISRIVWSVHVMSAVTGGLDVHADQDVFCMFELLPRSQPFASFARI